MPARIQSMKSDGISVADVRSAARQLLAYCHAENWAGYDPYDALNSKLLTALPIGHSKFPQLIVTQVLKRSPINFRSLLLVPKTQNPKAIALFLSAVLKAPELCTSETGDLVALLTDLLVAL